MLSHADGVNTYPCIGHSDCHGQRSQKVINMSHDIIDTAVANGSFKTLAAALGAAGLVETLKGAGPFTVFAPTDAAFAALPAGTVESLLKPDAKAQLTAILTYHVVPGKVMSSDLAGKTMSPTTVQGGPLAIDATGSTVHVGNATVSTPDVDCSNGVIHVIDKVLMPSDTVAKAA